MHLVLQSSDCSCTHLATSAFFDQLYILKEFYWMRWSWAIKDWLSVRACRTDSVSTVTLKLVIDKDGLVLAIAKKKKVLFTDRNIMFMPQFWEFLVVTWNDVAVLIISSEIHLVSLFVYTFLLELGSFDQETVTCHKILKSDLNPKSSLGLDGYVKIQLMVGYTIPVQGTHNCLIKIKFSL